MERTHPIKTPVRFVAEESKSLPEIFLRRSEASGQKVAYMVRDGAEWTSTTWRRFYEQAAGLATFLMRNGLAAGDKICITGGTRPSWAIADMGGQLAGLVTVGAYPTLAPKQLAYIIAHSDTKIAVAEGLEEAEKLLEIRSQVPKLERVLIWQYDDLPVAMRENEWFMSFDEAAATPEDRQAIDARLQAINTDDTAIIIYTSGTTGDPKGAMLSHGNIRSVLLSLEDLMPIDGDDISLNFLPMAHAAERIAGFYLRIDAGIACAYATSIPAVLEEIKQVRPTLFGSVPRIFEKAYAKIMSEVAGAPPAKQKIFAWADKTGRAMVRDWQAGRASPLTLRLQYKLADKLVFSKIREVFGGRVKHFLTGAAPISLEILEFFWAVGFPIYEVYGMTEATVITHANRGGSVKLGTVGLPIPGVEDKLAEDGEILMRGPTIFKGYYKNPQATAETIDADGWLHSGDIGRRGSDGFLRIVDRKKHIIITAGGKNITPANIEQEIKGNDPLISQVHAHGDRRAYLTALVTVHPMEVIEWAKAHNLVTDRARTDAIVQELMTNPLARPAGLDELMKLVTGQDEIKRRVVAAVKRANGNLSKVEAIKKVFILERDFSLEEDEITPTMKVKRKEVEKKYAPLFDRVYAEPECGLVVETGSAG